MRIGINCVNANFDHTVLAEVISSRWKEDRPFFTVNREARGAPLEGSWFQQPPNRALKLHLSRRCPRIPVAELPPPLKAKLLGVQDEPINARMFYVRRLPATPRRTRIRATHGIITEVRIAVSDGRKLQARSGDVAEQETGPIEDSRTGRQLPVRESY